MGTSDTLRSVIDAGRSSKRLDELSSARVIGKVARQLHAAQQKAGAGTAVGPVTPAQIEILASGEVKLELGGSRSLGYSSPEQIDGGAGDRRSDVFSLGAVLWEALTHTRLFDAMNDAAVKAAVKEREITPPSQINANVPAELSAICMRALSRNPADRYQSLKAMAVEIEEFLEEAGYEDSDAKIASYLAKLHETPKPAAGAQAPAHASNPSAAAESALPRAQVAATAIGVPKLADWQDTSTPAHAPPPAAAPVVSVERAEPASVANAASAAGAPAATPATSVPAVPLPPVLPAGSTTPASDGATKATAEKTPAATPSDADKPRAASQSDADKPRAASQSDADKPRAASQSDADKPRATSQSDAVPSAASASKSAPHPAAAVSLGPIPGSRESKDVLAGWGWGTGKQEAITDGYDDDDDGATSDTRKILTYVIGGGLAVAALVTIIALASGSNDRAKDAKAVAKQTETARPAIDRGAPPSEPDPIAGAVATGSADSALAQSSTALDQTAGSAAEPGSAADAEATRAAEEAEAERLAAEKAEAERLAAEKAEAERLAAERAQAAKAEAERLAAERAQAKKAEAERLAAERRAKREAAAERRQATKAQGTTKTSRKTVAGAAPKVDAQTAYRTGLQQYARGDTRGALASLRSALAANPSYAPTWRGLGLVFEKLGEKAQARAAYKRYLQLAPGAGDAAQIRGRLERLGS